MEGWKEGKRLHLTGLICVKSQASAVSGELPPPLKFSPPRYVGNACMGGKLVGFRGRDATETRVGEMLRCWEFGSEVHQ
jgi:hypothetical protein